MEGERRLSLDAPRLFHIGDRSTELGALGQYRLARHDHGLGQRSRTGSSTLLVFEASVLRTVTLSFVPAGIVTSRNCGAGGAAGFGVGGASARSGGAGAGGADAGGGRVVRTPLVRTPAAGCQSLAAVQLEHTRWRILPPRQERGTTS